MTPVAGITSNTVPWEILRAAGYSPRLLDAGPGPTPFADRLMEDSFDGRMRGIFDLLCSGECGGMEVVVIPRTSEPEHKLYLYLREAARLGYSGAIPDLYLYNLLHTLSPESYDYGLARTQQMARDFQVTEAALRDAIGEGNRARAAVREILQKRREGLLPGSVALELIRGFYTGEREAFARSVPAQLERLCSPAPQTGPRILIMGAAVNSCALHHSVEGAGGYVAAEDDWRGSRAAGERDVRSDIDPVTAIFEKYFYDEVSPRIPSAAGRDQWLERQLTDGEIAGVVFYLPLEDDVEGWDYPRRLALLNARRIPSIDVRDSSASAQITTFIRSLS